MWLASEPVARRVVINERESLLQKQRLLTDVGVRPSVPRQKRKRDNAAPRFYPRPRTPAAFAVWVAMASISGGDRQS
jgi:hypothetical protein